MLRFLILAALVGLAPSAAAQADVNGFIRDAATGETLIGATVLAEGLGRGAASNSQGFFALGNLPAGDVTLVVSFIGYETARETLTLADGETRRLEFELGAEGVVGEEVTVQADRPLDEERAVGVQEISIRLVEELPTVFEADLFRSIQLLPGVKSSSDFSSKLYIRGGSPDQTLILLDGTTVYNPTHFFGFFSTFNTDAIKDVKLYKGAYPPEYGGRLGSVIDIYNRDGNRNRTAGSATLGVLASRVGVEGPLPGSDGRGSYSLNARRSTLEPLLAVLRENIDQEGIPESFYFYDLNGKVGLDLTQNDRVSVAGYAGRDRVLVPFGEDSEFDLDYGNRTLSASYNRVLSGTAFAQARGTSSYYFSRPVGRVAETEFERPNTIRDLSGRLDIDWLPTERFEASAGVWGGTFDLGLQSAFNGRTQTDFAIDGRYLSGYVQAKVRPASGWIVSGGARVEGVANEVRTNETTAPRKTFVRVSPQLQVERTFGPDLVVQAAVGRYHQFLSLISNEAFSGFDTWVTTGEGVGPQSSDQAVLGVKTRLGSGYRFDIELYGRTMRDLFDTRPDVQDISGLDYVDYFRFGEGYAYGTEMLLEKGTGRVTGLVGYTLGVTRRRYPDEPAFADWFAPKYDRLHDLNVVLNYGLGRGWKATVAGSYATGQAYTEPTSRYTIAGQPVGGGEFDGLYTPELNNARLDAYHRVDVGLTREGRFFGIGDYELQVQAINVYNRRNVWFVTYDFDDNPIVPDPVRQLPTLPNVSLTVRF